MLHGLFSAPNLRGEPHLGLHKEPIYGYVPEQPEEEATVQDRLLVDSFLILYWGSVIAFVLFMNYVVVPYYWPDEEEEEEEDESVDALTPRRREQDLLLKKTTTEVFQGIDKNDDGKITKEEWQKARIKAEQEGVDNMFGGTSSTSAVMEPKEVDLPPNMWTLNMVAAIGQATAGKHTVSAYLTGIVTLGMAFLQIFALFLVVHDINPDATPVTTVPKDPWIEGGWSVNTMKWLMVTFMSLLMVTEAGECRQLLTCIAETNSQRLLCPRWFLTTVCSFQYIIMLFVIWGGVAAVLSFQSVPDILYSSMSITYIAKVDEAFFVMCVQLFNIEANFLVIHGKKVAKMEAQDLFKAIDKDGDGDVTKEELQAFQESLYDIVHDPKLRPEKISHQMSVALHCLAAFPVFLGFALIGRAMMTNVMPTDRFHDIKNFLLGLMKR